MARAAVARAAVAPAAVTRAAVAVERWHRPRWRSSGHPIGLAWDPGGLDAPAAIEVYPAATLIAHGLPTRGYKRLSSPARPAIARWLRARLEQVDVVLTALEAHALDAVLCVAAGIDFLAGEAIAPEVPAIVRREGWIWVKG